MVLSIILPTYNEAGNIGKLINKIRFHDELKKIKIEFIVVDDNSQDNTQEIIKKLINKKFNINLIIRKKERGLATAILTGLKQAKGRNIVIMDTDFNHRPEDVARLIEPIMRKKSDLVVGSRYITGGGMHASEASRWQYWLSRWGNYLVNHFILHLPVHESLSGFLAIKKSALDTLPYNKIFFGYGEYCIRLIFYCHNQKYKIKEIPIMYGLRRYGISKSSLKRMVYYYLKTALELKFISSKPHV